MDGGFTLPAALLAQYPALQGMQWDTMTGQDDPGELSGRGSFDASSGGEYYDDDDPNGGYVSGPGTSYAQDPNLQNQMPTGSWPGPGLAGDWM